ncbi:MAG: alpha-amylase family glycosyl hydrolase [Candidatus Acidiferrales bacterium]
MPNPCGSSSRIGTRAHPHLYEINTWAWLEQLSSNLNRSINLAQVPDSEWDRFAERGFDIVWMMGIWQRSAESRRIWTADTGVRSQYDHALPGWKPQDVAGSPYAVGAYAPDPRIGTWEDLDRARAALRRRGIALYLDFVSNHTALDHPWTREHPEFYVQGSAEDFQKNPGLFYRLATPAGDRYVALARDLYCPPWIDAAQINHFDPGARAAQIETLRTLAAHCDGVRCDMAMLLLSDIFEKIWSHYLPNVWRPQTEFWTEAHDAVPDLTLLAEAYWGTESRLLYLGFSYAYDKELYDAVRDARLVDIRGHLQASVDYQSRLARFLENHDEARCALVFPHSRLKSAGTLMGTLPGMRLYHQGELEGRRIHFPIQLRTAAPEPADPESAAFFDKILEISNEDVFHAGRWNLLEVFNEGDSTAGNLIAYQWRTEKSWKLVAVNLTSTPAQGRIKLADSARPAIPYIFDDQLNQVLYDRNGSELHALGLFVRLEAGQAHIFDIKPA